jgi:hypothetical protein
MTKLIVAIATLALFAGYAIAQLAITPVASYEVSSTYRNAEVIKLVDGDITCFIVNARKAPAISCVK